MLFFFPFRVNCSFYFKIGACRHGDRCSRIHNKPTFSQVRIKKFLLGILIILIINIFETSYRRRLTFFHSFNLQSSNHSLIKWRHAWDEICWLQVNHSHKTMRHPNVLNNYNQKFELLINSLINVFMQRRNNFHSVLLWRIFNISNWYTWVNCVYSFPDMSTSKPVCESSEFCQKCRWLPL